MSCMTVFKAIFSSLIGTKNGGGVVMGVEGQEMMYRFLGRLEDPHSLQEISLC